MPTRAKRTLNAPTVKPLTKRKAWAALKAHHKQISRTHLRKLFADDSKRAERFTVEAAGIYLDYSKNLITEKTIKLLLDLARESKVQERRDAMFRGEKINITENRAVLHVALRAPKTRPSLWMERMSYRKCTRSSTKWRTFRTVFAAASGRATAESASATSSTSGLAAPISAR